MSIGQVKISTSVDQLFSDVPVSDQEKEQLSKIKAKFRDMNFDQVSKLRFSDGQYWKVRTGMRELSRFTSEFLKSHPQFLNEKKAMEFSSAVRGINMRPARFMASEMLGRMDLAEDIKEAKAVSVINQYIRSEQQKIQKINKTIDIKSTLRKIGRAVGPVGIIGGIVGLVLLGVFAPFTLPVFAVVIALTAAATMASHLVTWLSLPMGKQGAERSTAMKNIAVCERYKEVIKKPEFTEWLQRNEAYMNDFKSNDFNRVEKAIHAYESSKA